MSCEYCKDLDLGKHKDGILLKLADIQEHCKYCSLLFRIAQYFTTPEYFNRKKGIMRIDQQDSTATNIEIISDADADKSSSMLSDVRLYRNLGAPSAELMAVGACRLLSTRPDSPECFDFIRDRIRNCCATHAVCQIPKCPPLPKRVISIGSRPGDAVRLVEAGSTTAPYIALSHCWGGHQPIMTTSSSFAQMQATIRWNDLSRVFQDAITIARELRIEWIWIDSLCIIQDSKADWEVESAKMCDYYSKAHLTLAASSSKNGTVHFLDNRDPYWQPVKFPFFRRDGQVTQLLVRRHLGSSMTQLVEDLSPLASRAWCWQENVLSTRVLHYTASELIFECKVETISEDGAVPRGLYSMRLAQKLSEPGGKERDPYECWHDLIESYSVRNITFESDKLPAVSGVAKRINDRVHSVYLAGLWKDNLLMELCWSVDYVTTDSTPLLQPKIYIAPSWSWASVNGALNFVSPDPAALFTPFASVLTVEVSVPGANQFGQVEDGYIIMKGPVSLIRLNCTSPEDCWSFTVGKDPMIREPFAVDCALSIDSIASKTTTAGLTLRRAQAEDRPMPFEIDVYCMHVGQQSGVDDTCVFGLVIAPSHLNDGTYIRIGLIQLDDRAWFEEDPVEMTLKIR